MDEEASENVGREFEKWRERWNGQTYAREQRMRAQQADFRDFFHRGPYAPPDGTANHGRE